MIYGANGYTGQLVAVEATRRGLNPVLAGRRAGPIERLAAELKAAMARDYYVWLLSDWAYLGGVRLVQLAARHGLKINHIPMRMQDVYAASGGVLLANRSWQRQAYRITELKRWRSRLGIPVNIEPKFFPVDVDLASCVVIAAQQGGLQVADFVNAVMRAIWAEDQNTQEPARGALAVKHVLSLTRAGQ
jgi:2-hydroxychromene-2-carboxylate isomerase